MKTIDLRSDTVTKPTQEMQKVMWDAKVGDDVFGEDPTVNLLEAMAAERFGMEAALFCPSGTMTNQIAIRILTQPQDEVICDWRSHIYNYEGGGIASNSMVSVKLVDAPRGILTPQDVHNHVRPEDIHHPASRLLAVENTVNKGGGSCYSVAQLEKIGQAAQQHNLAYHLDGARLFNALIAQKEQPESYGPLFDTISICLSKGLGAPVGSLLLANKDLIKKARRVRKVFGGGMRQAGYLAAAGIYAIEHHIDRLAEDHHRAQELGNTLQELPWVEAVLPVETNIVIATLSPKVEVSCCIAQLAEKGVLAVPFGPKEIRFVTHLDFSDHDLTLAKQIIESL